MNNCLRRMRKIIIMLTVLTVLTPAFTGSVQAAAVQLSQSELMEISKQASRMMEAEKFAEAYELLIQNYPGNEMDNNFNFLLGQCTAMLGKYPEAIQYYKKILEKNPDLPRVRLELGRSYAAAGQAKEAKQEFNAVLATSPPPIVAEHVKKFLAMLDANKKVSIRASMSYIYDNNVNVGPEDIIFYNGWTIDFRKQSDHAVTTAVAVDVASDTKLVGALQSGLNYSRTAYANHPELSTEDISMSSGITRKFKKMAFSIPLVVKYSAVGGQKYSTAYGISPQAQFILSDKRQLTVSLSGMQRTFHTASARDGRSYSLNVGERFKLKQDNSFVEIGLSRSTDTAKAADLASTAGSVYLTYYTPIFKKYNLLVQTSLGKTDYGGTDSYSESVLNNPQSRHDRQKNLLINISRTIKTRTYTLGVNIINNSSNFQLYQYERTQLNFQIAQIF